MSEMDRTVETVSAVDSRIVGLPVARPGASACGVGNDGHEVSTFILPVVVKGQDTLHSRRTTCERDVGLKWVRGW